MRIVLVGFGAVGQSLTYLLETRRSQLVTDFGINPKVIGVADGGGAAVCIDGLNHHRLVEAKRSGSVAAYSGFGRTGMSAIDLIEVVEADVVVEATPTNIVTGEPGLTHLKHAFRAGRHVITTNKGPLALAFPRLVELARHNGALFRFSGTVGGGMPILDFAKKCLRGDRIVEVKGVLNGTTNYLLTRMETKGIAMDEALNEAQRLGIVERDPYLDVDGIDAAAKLVIIANCVLDKSIVLGDVDVEGIRNVTAKDLKEAVSKGKTIKLVASSDGKARVGPVKIARSSPLNVKGTYNAITFVSETAGEETLIAKGAGGIETASAIVRDLVHIKERLMEDTAAVPKLRTCNLE